MARRYYGTNPAPQVQTEGGVGTLSDAQGNVFAPKGPKLGLDFSAASTWAWMMFIACLLYIFGIYFLHGGRRGGVL